MRGQRTGNVNFRLIPPPAGGGASSGTGVATIPGHEAINLLLGLCEKLLVPTQLSKVLNIYIMSYQNFITSCQYHSEKLRAVITFTINSEYIRFVATSDYSDLKSY